jgi:hypothetical protein
MIMTPGQCLTLGCRLWGAMLRLQVAAGAQALLAARAFATPPAPRHRP